MGKDLEGTGRNVIVVLSWHLAGVSEENQDILQSKQAVSRPSFEPRTSEKESFAPADRQHWRINKQTPWLIIRMRSIPTQDTATVRSNLMQSSADRERGGEVLRGQRGGSLRPLISVF
jgi:hypothetical protein